MKLALKIFGVLVVLLALGYGALYVRYAMPLPTGAGGTPADQLALRIQAAAKVGSWAETGAVAWTFAGRNEHLWDRERGLVRVRWKGGEALVELQSRRGVARKGEQLVTDPAEKAKMIEKAYAAWINDSFWLNPIAKLFDEGVVRTVIERPGGEPETTGLLVTYTSGGLTPGDSYLWIVKAGSDLPTSVRMWVSNLPLPGLPVTWASWTTLESGAQVATHHELPLGIPVEVTDVRGATTLRGLTGGGTDPFAPLLVELRSSRVD